jgi:hypothetical protein
MRIRINATTPDLSVGALFSPEPVVAALPSP